MDALVSVNRDIKERPKMTPSVAPLTPSRKKNLNGCSTPSNGKKVRGSPAGQSYVVGSRVEAKDFSGHWYPATVSEVDWEEREILIHFDNNEEWMPMDSQRVRPFKEPDASSLFPPNPNPGRIAGMNGRYLPEPKPVEKRYKVGEQVMATWTNNRKYPATIASQLPNDRYEVIFDDGFVKSVRGSKISKKRDSDMVVPPGNRLHMQPSTQYHHQQLGHTNGYKGQYINGSLSSVQPKSGTSGQSQLEKQLLQPPTLPSASLYSRSPAVNGLLPIDENIGTKEQRRERKRKHNVKELFSTKRPRGSDKLASAKARVDKKALSGFADSAASSISTNSVHPSSNGLLLGVDPMFPANPMKVEGLPASSLSHSIRDRSSADTTESESKKKRKRLKKKQDGFGSDTQESLSSKRPKAVSSDDEECSIQWTNGEPQGEAAYVIESAEGLRKSIIVDDRRLPVGWSKHAIRRQGGTSAGKWDVFLVRPDASPANPASEGSSLPSPQSFMDHPTANQVSSHPPAPHAVNPLGAHGMQRVKTLLPRRAPSSCASPNRRVLSPPPPHAVTPQPVMPMPPTEEALSKKSLSVGSDGFICPKDGCGKRFRKENLLQMHIKHYHPEYTAFMGSTPNVADLAYARTVGESVSDTPNRNRAGQNSSFMEKIERISRMEAHRKAGFENPVSGVEAPSSLEARSPTLGQLLKKGPMRKDSLDGTTAAAQAAAAWMVETAGDSAANMSPIPETFRDRSGLPPQTVFMDCRDKTENSSRPVSRAAGLPTDCDQDMFGEQSGNRSPWKGGAGDGIMSASSSSSPVTVQSPSSYFYSKKKKNRSGIDKPTSIIPKVEGGKPPSPPMEHLRREELINCTCGFTEEDGLMIQCDLCLCWQHGLCNQIENIEDVPQKYVCQICQNPLRERKSRHFIHDQDWLKEGILPSLSFTVKDQEKVQQREDILKRSHDLCSLLLMTQKVIHSLRVKLHIAEQKDHPKLYLWANSWQTESMGCPTPPSSPTQAIDQKLDTFNTPRIPQPEAPIDPGECRLKLLDHIEHYQSLIDTRLSTLEQMIDELEREDPTLLDSKLSESTLTATSANKDISDQGEEEAGADFFPQTKETVLMILRDLSNLRKITTLC